MFHVKHTDHSFKLTGEAVIDAALRVGVDVSSAQAGLITEHAALVVDANRHVNLTRLTGPDDVLSLHIVDSLAFLTHVQPLEGHVVDIGSGAGYPGVPLAILGADVTLCESVKKKASFLVETVQTLGLSVSVVPLRAEELAALSPASAEVVIARAVSATSALLELASPLLGLGGRLIALKGTPTDEELDRAARVAAMCGMRESAAEKYVLPTGEQRTVLVFEKFERSSLRLPRRPGAAQRQPLG